MDKYWFYLEKIIICLYYRKTGFTFKLGFTFKVFSIYNRLQFYFIAKMLPLENIGIGNICKLQIAVWIYYRNTSFTLEIFVIYSLQFTFIDQMLVLLARYSQFTDYNIF